MTYVYIYIYISLFAYTSYKVVHRKCNCIQTECKKLKKLLKYINTINSVMGENLSVHKTKNKCLFY